MAAERPSVLGSPRSASARGLRPAWIWAAIASVAAVAVYSNALDNPFVFDDRTEILENPSIRSLSDLGAILLHSPTRPLVNLSYALDYARTGLQPFGYHVTNVLLHAMNVALLFMVVRNAVRDLGGRFDTALAFGAASLFAVHPMMTGAVGYVSARAELLSATFVLGSLLVFRLALRHADWRPTFAGWAFFLAALGSKETAVMLPLVVLAYDVLVLRGRQAPGRWQLGHVHVPLLLVMSAAAVARLWVYLVVEHPSGSGQWANVLVNVDVAARYLALLTVPHSQAIVHPVVPITSLADSRLLVASGVLALAGAGAWWARRREPLVTFGVLWLFLLMLPSAALIVLSDRGQPMAEHRIYLASCGFFMAATAAAVRMFDPAAADTRRRVIGGVACAALLVTFGALTIARNRVWADPVWLWQEAVQKAPLTYASHYGLADAYRWVGDCEAAVPSYARAAAIRPEQGDAYLGMADCLADTGRFDDARLALRSGLERSADPRVRLTLAAYEEKRQNRSEALRLCREVLAGAPVPAAVLSAAEACIGRHAEIETP